MKLEDIIQQNLIQPLDYLKKDPELCREVQTRLNAFGLLSPKDIDGIYGPLTKTAFEQFKQKTQQEELDKLGAGSAQLLLNLEQLPTGGDLITKEQAKFIYGNPISNKQLTDLNFCLDRFKINTHARMRHFLSQTAHESGGLKWMKELDSGKAYEGRKDLGNIHPGDGPKYKGAGVIQLTGRNNYQALANYLNDPKIMEGVNYVSVTYPFTSAGFWWNKNNINAHCDNGATVKEITHLVNGGYHGLEQRQAYYLKALEVFPG